MCRAGLVAFTWHRADSSRSIAMIRASRFVGSTAGSYLVMLLLAGLVAVREYEVFLPVLSLLW